MIGALLTSNFAARVSLYRIITTIIIIIETRKKKQGKKITHGRLLEHESRIRIYTCLYAKKREERRYIIIQGFYWYTFYRTLCRHFMSPQSRCVFKTKKKRYGYLSFFFHRRDAAVISVILFCLPSTTGICCTRVGNTCNLICQNIQRVFFFVNFLPGILINRPTYDNIMEGH